MPEPPPVPAAPVPNVAAAETENVPRRPQTKTVWTISILRVSVLTRPVAALNAGDVNTLELFVYICERPNSLWMNLCI